MATTLVMATENRESIESRIARRAEELAKDRAEIEGKISDTRDEIKRARERIKGYQILLTTLPKPPGTRKRKAKQAAGASES